MVNQKKVVIKLLLDVLLLVLITSPLNVHAGNDFIVVNLRIDPIEVSSSLDYRVWLAAESGPTWQTSTFTTAWLSVDLNNQPGLFGHEFSQIGLMAFTQGLQWFVYSEAGVICNQGSYGWWNPDKQMYLGCYGPFNQEVTYGKFYAVELVKYPLDNFWIARLINEETNYAIDVAFFLSGRNTIFDVSVNMEESWPTAQDPYENGVFHMWHPQYNSWQDGFREWPLSINGEFNNRLYTVPASICPNHYAADILILNDPRYWKAGSINGICQAIMFPSTQVVLPIALR